MPAHRTRSLLHPLLIGALACTLGVPLARATDDPLSEITLEELLDIEVVSASRRSQRLVEVPSAGASRASK
jgi:hypothetical protein